MKKLIASILAIYVLAACSLSFAEQAEPHVEGEWYVLQNYSNEGLSVSEINGNTYVFQNKYGDRYTFKDEGYVLFESEGTSEEIVTEYASAEGVSLYYYIQDNDIYGYMLLDRFGEWRMYNISISNTLFLLGGKIIPYGDKQTGEYLYRRNMLYITTEDTYIRGSVEWRGQDAFIYSLDEEEYTVQFGDTEVNYGTPFVVFVSTTIGK